MTHDHGIIAQLYPLPAWEVTPPGDIFRVFERGGRNIGTQFPEIGLPDSTGEIRASGGAGPARHPPVQSRARHRPARRRSRSSTSPRRGSTIPSPGSSAPTTIPAIIAIPAAPRATWSMPTTATSRRPAPTPSSATAAPAPASIRPFPKTNAAHPLRHVMTDAIPTEPCMICHMHQPNLFMNTYARLHDVGLRDGGAADVAGEAEISDRRRESAPSTTAIPKARRRAAIGPIPISAPMSSDAQSPDQGHPVRRLSRPWLELPRRLQARPQGQPARRRQQHRRERRSGEVQEGGASRSIHVDYGMQCVDCHFAQDAHGSGHIYGEVQGAIEITCVDCHGTVDGLSQLCAPAVPPRRPAAPICRCCAPPTAASASNGATASSISARRSIPTSNGR